MAAAALSLTSTAAAARYWWVLAVAPLVLALLYPPVLGRAIDMVLRALRRPPLERRPTPGGIARAAAWTAAGWVLWGTQAWLLLRDVTGKGLGVLLVSLGAYALAWSAGTIAVIFPGGIGPRELALVAALAPVAARGPALVVAVLSRLLMTGSDLVWGGAGLLIGRRLARLVRQAAEKGAGQAGDPGLRQRGRGQPVADGGLDGPRGGQQVPFGTAPADELQADGQARGGEAGGHGDGGQAGDRDQVAGRHPVQVGVLRDAVDRPDPVQSRRRTARPG